MSHPSLARVGSLISQTADRIQEGVSAGRAIDRQFQDDRPVGDGCRPPGERTVE